MKWTLRLAAMGLLMLSLQGLTYAQDGKSRTVEAPTQPTPTPAAVTALTPCVDGTAGGFACDNVDLLAFLPITSMGGSSRAETNDIWGWTDPVTGTEYALVGLTTGTAFVDLSDPENPVYIGFLATQTVSSTWRDIKVYDDHAFIVADGAGAHGMQIFDLNQLRDVASPPVTFSNTAFYNGIGNTHNVVINEDTGFAYLVGSLSGGTQPKCGGGLHVVNIQTPTAPSYSGCFGGDGYTHDAQCVTYSGPDPNFQGSEICVALNEDTVTIVDVTNKNSMQLLARTGYPADAYTHQGWLSEDQSTLFVDDELDEFSGSGNTRTLVWDLQQLDDPILLNEHISATRAADHNQYVVGDYLYQSNYTAGVRILDISTPGTPSEVAFFDTSPFTSLSFSGSWSNYPFFASGIVIATNIETGLFVLQPTLGSSGNTCDNANVIMVDSFGFNWCWEGTSVQDGATGPDDLVCSGPGIEMRNGAVDVYTASSSSAVVCQNTRLFEAQAINEAPDGCNENSDSFLYDGSREGNLAYSGTWQSRCFGEVISSGEWSGTFDPDPSIRGGASIQHRYALPMLGKRALRRARAAQRRSAQIRKNDTETPSDFTLTQNYPNPFNPTTSIQYTLPEATVVRLTIYNALGQAVRTLVNSEQAAGSYTVSWDATNEAGQALPSGVYLYHLEAGNFSQSLSMTLMK